MNDFRAPASSKTRAQAGSQEYTTSGCNALSLWPAIRIEMRNTLNRMGITHRSWLRYPAMRYAHPFNRHILILSLSFTTGCKSGKVKFKQRITLEEEYFTKVLHEISHSHSSPRHPIISLASTNSSKTRESEQPNGILTPTYKSMTTCFSLQ